MSAHTDDSALFEENLARLFGHYAAPHARQRAEALGWMPDLWAVLADGGLASVGVPESAGGVGGSFSDVAALLRMAGRHAVALPLAEMSGLLGGWLVAEAGLALPQGPLSVPLPRPADYLVLKGSRVSGFLQRVPWGGQVTAVVALATSKDGIAAVLLDPREATIARGRNVAGEPRDSLTFDDATLASGRMAPVAPTVGDELQLRGALSRALVMAGALEAVAELTVRYSGERHQFGRPVGRFQAVAQRLARLTSETEAAALAAAVALRRFEVVGTDATFEVAAAKTTVGRAAGDVTVDAHQVHGAMGMSQEYPLHHFTRRLWAWRQEWGSETYWAQQLGRHVVNMGSHALWPRLATGLMNDDTSISTDLELAT